MTDEPPFQPVVWVGSSRKDLREFPEPVQDHMGYALFVAQQGGKHRDTKALTGFGGAGVVEIIKDHRGDTFPAVYTLPISGGGVRASRLPEEIQDRTGNAAPGHGID
jgi:phage-related protein